MGDSSTGEGTHILRGIQGSDTATRQSRGEGGIIRGRSGHRGDERRERTKREHRREGKEGKGRKEVEGRKDGTGERE